jgi:hypothetical protein
MDIAQMFFQGANAAVVALPGPTFIAQEASVEDLATITGKEYEDNLVASEELSNSIVVRGGESIIERESLG